jgi:hypothetical protein
MDELLSKALRAICLTRDYVGEKILPPIEGWEWFDAGTALAEAIPDDEWARQFHLRVEASLKTERLNKVTS